MRALLTGATGFLGSHLAARLVADGHDVHVIVRQTSNLVIFAKIMNSITIHVIGDECDVHQMDIIAASTPDIVFHLSTHFVAEHSAQDVPALIDSNVLFPCGLVDAMVRRGIKRLVNCSSAWQHYNDATYDPVCLYAATKEAFLKLAQFYVAAGGLSVIDRTISDTYGPKDRRPKLFSALYASAANGVTLAFSPGHQLLDMLYVDDAINAFCTAAGRLMHMEDGRMETYAIRSGQAVSLRQVVSMFCRVTGLSPRIDWGVKPYRKREMMDPWTGGIALPEWQPLVGLEEGIRKMHNHHVLDTRN
jgi:nucleoside-diphosphate-sugar epimerase